MVLLGMAMMLKVWFLNVADVASDRWMHRLTDGWAWVPDQIGRWMDVQIRSDLWMDGYAGQIRSGDGVMN